MRSSSMNDMEMAMAIASYTCKGVLFFFFFLHFVIEKETDCYSLQPPGANRK